MSVHVTKCQALGVCSVLLLWAVVRSTQPLTAERALVSRVVRRLGWLSSLKRAVETTSLPPARTGQEFWLFLSKNSIRLNFILISALENAKY